MIWLWLGVLLWSGLHLVKGVAPGARASLIATIGEIPFKILIAVGLALAIVLMVVGWRASTPVEIYAPPAWGPAAGLVLILLAFLLFAWANVKTNVKRFVRHPQLTGLALWAAGHLLANGDSRSLVLFGALGLWAVVEIPLINRREGPRVVPEPVPLKAEVRPALIGLAVFVVVLVVHPWLFGVAGLPV
jgi:uncharacterized membrane protein